MKKLITLIILISFTALGYSQDTQIDYFVKKSASTATAFESSDSVFVSQRSIIRIVELSSSGSSVEYLNADGRNIRVEVKEEIDDSSTTKATFAFNFVGTSDTLDSITVNGVNISNAVNLAGQSADSLAEIVADSINGFASSPNYTAAASGATVTITAADDSTAASNGFIVRIFTDAGVSTSTGIMGGGFTKRNIKNMFGSTVNNNLVEINQLGVSEQVLLNSSRVMELAPRNPSGSIIRYDGERRSYEYRSTDSRNTLKTNFSAK